MIGRIHLTFIYYDQQSVIYLTSETSALNNDIVYDNDVCHTYIKDFLKERYVTLTNC